MEDIRKGAFVKRSFKRSQSVRLGFDLGKHLPNNGKRSQPFADGDFSGESC